MGSGGYTEGTDASDSDDDEPRKTYTAAASSPPDVEKGEKGGVTFTEDEWRRILSESEQAAPLLALPPAPVRDAWKSDSTSRTKAKAEVERILGIKNAQDILEQGQQQKNEQSSEGWRAFYTQTSVWSTENERLLRCAASSKQQELCKAASEKQSP